MADPRDLKHPSTEQPLLDGTRYAGENVVGVCADYAESSDDDHEDHSQHHSIFRNVLSLILRPQPAKKLDHYRLQESLTSMS